MWNSSLDVNSYVTNFVWKTARTPTILDTGQASLRPLYNIHKRVFGTDYGQIMDRASWSSQIIILEEILNLESGYTYSVGVTSSVHNAIYIRQFTDEIDDNYFYNEIEFGATKQKYIGNEHEQSPLIYLYNKQEADISFDFEVMIPQDFGDQILLKNTINNLKIAGTKYIITKKTT